MTRFVSFRFDDGFRQSAEVARTFLEPGEASFFLVAGLVSGTCDRSVDPHFLSADFANAEFWSELCRDGYDIQPHSVTHRRLTDLAPDEALIEIEASCGFIASLRDSAQPTVFCAPYNQMPALRYPPSLNGAGFLNRSSDFPINYNLLTDLDAFKIRSWAVRERHLDSICRQLEALPPESWTVLTFHSFDGVGFEPWTSSGFGGLVDFVRRRDFTVLGVGPVFQRIGLFPKANAA